MADDMSLRSEGMPAPGQALEPRRDPRKWSRVTLAQFGLLRDRMTYAEAAEALGCAGLQHYRSLIVDASKVMYVWQGNGGRGTNVHLLFQDDRLISKAQFGLK